MVALLIMLMLLLMLCRLVVRLMVILLSQANFESVISLPFECYRADMVPSRG